MLARGSLLNVLCLAQGSGNPGVLLRALAAQEERRH